jgi:hypothetical protein
MLLSVLTLQVGDFTQRQAPSCQGSKPRRPSPVLRFRTNGSHGIDTSKPDPLLLAPTLRCDGIAVGHPHHRPGFRATGDNRGHGLTNGLGLTHPLTATIQTLGHYPQRQNYRYRN